MAPGRNTLDKPLWRGRPPLAGRLAVLAVTVVLGVSACSSSGSSSTGKPASSGKPAGTTTAGGAAPASVKQGGNLTVGIGALPPTLDPFLSFPTPPRSYTVGPLYSYLDTVDASASGAPVEPAVATSWKATTPTTWVFTLKPGLMFSNGEPMDAAAVKYVADYVRDPASASGLGVGLGPVTSVTVVNPTTVQFNLSSPEFTFPRLIASLPLVPPKDFAARGKTAFLTSPISGGIFKIAKFVPGQSLELVPNPDSVMGKTHLDSVTFTVMVEDASRISALQANQVDVVTKVPTDLAGGLKSAGDSVVAVNEDRLYLTDLYKPSGPLHDQRVRMALNMALDTQSLVTNVMGGYGLDEQGQLSPPTVAGFCPSVKSIPFNLAAANQLLAAAGVTHLNLTLDTSQGFLLNDSLLAQAIAGQLEKLNGVKVTIDTLEFSKYLDVFEGKAPAGDLFAWGLSSAPYDDITPNLARFTTKFSNRNPGMYSNPTYDADYTKLLATSDGDPSRQSLECQMSQIIRDQALVLFGFYTPDIWGTTSKVKAFTVDHDGNPNWLTIGLSS